MTQQGGGAVAAAVGMLADAMTNLKVGVLTNLILNYRSREAPSEVTLLAGAVMAEATLEPSALPEVGTFAQTHASLVREEALKLCENASVVDALSYFYAAETLRLAMVTRNPMSDEAMTLGERATELGIYIPNTYDICGSGDAGECVRAIAQFAERYREQSFGR